MQIVLFSDPVTKSGYIVVCETMPVDGFNMPCYEVITPHEYPNIYNILWYVQRAYKGYNWHILTM